MASARLTLLILTCAVLWSLESVVPLRRFGGDRLRRALPNVALTAILVAMNVALSAGVAWVSRTVRVGLFVHIAASRLIELALAVVVLDFFAYVAHVAMHHSAAGWRFHRVHHSDEAVDVTTAFRQHPGETVWRVLWQLPAVVLLALPMWMVAVYLLVSTLNAQLEHANIRVPVRLDRIARRLLVTPDMHKIHHSRLERETNSNYANIFSLWDRLFATYTADVDLATLRYGLDGLNAQRFTSLMALPFRPTP